MPKKRLEKYRPCGARKASVQIEIVAPDADACRLIRATGAVGQVELE
jgi:hypothetical protein